MSQSLSRPTPPRAGQASISARRISPPSARWTHVAKIPLVLMVAFALVMGIWAALVRLGWTLPTPVAGLAGLHGPLMISGMLGTLIGLERAVAMANLITGRVDFQTRRIWHWAYLAPLGSGLGALLLVLGNATAAQIATIGASAVLVLVYARLLRLHRAAYTTVMGLGALAWLVGNLLWFAQQPFFLIVHWWIAFLVLTVVGERLELARMTALTAVRRNLFLLAVGIYLGGVALTPAALATGIRLSGAGVLLLALWMARYDIARRTVYKTGVARYIAVCLLSGYAWLGIAGLVGLWAGALYGGFLYDAYVHAILLGFIFAMIFGHAPIILPALTGLHVAFHRGFYAPLVALHLTLLVRLAADLGGWFDGRLWGGLLNALTLVLFFITLARSIRKSPQP